MIISWEVFHTVDHRGKRITFPVLAEGNHQWLGDGYYFWKDYEFAEWWGDKVKCSPKNTFRKYDIYIAELQFDEEELIDTVFNEEDYYFFLQNIEKFAKKFTRIKKKKPTLEEFNDFIEDFGIWDDIKVIRFQDIPARNSPLIKVKNFFYKKRIQIRVNSPSKIKKFKHFKEKHCV